MTYLEQVNGIIFRKLGLVFPNRVKQHKVALVPERLLICCHVIVNNVESHTLLVVLGA